MVDKEYPFAMRIKHIIFVVTEPDREYGKSDVFLFDTNTNKVTDKFSVYVPEQETCIMLLKSMKQAFEPEEA